MLSTRRGFALALFAVSLFLIASPATAQTPTEMGSGAAWIDCDHDGDLDLLYLTPFGDAILLEYDHESDDFNDVTLTGLPDATRNIDAAGMGIACADFDNDGWVDVFLSMEGPNHLLLNNGDGTFRASTRASGIRADGDGEALSASVAVLDYDGDGWVDIFLGNYAGRANQMFRNLGPNNAGVVQFEDVAPALGLDWAEGNGSDWALGVAVADYDNDGDIDLYVANDYNGLAEGGGGLNPGDNMLYRNNGDGTFTDVSVASGANDPGWAMGVDFGDYNADGHLDIFLSNFFEDALLKNNGDGTFTNVTEATGLIKGTPGEWHYNGWGTAFFDFDNDGDLDIHVANGYILNDQGQVVNEPNQLWENQGIPGSGEVQFKDISEKAGIDDVGDARGASYGDFNQDGLLDFMVVNNGYLSGEDIIPAPARLLYINAGDGTFQDRGQSYGLRTEFSDGEKPAGYRDYTDNHWIQIHLEGFETNLSAIGARVEVTAGDRVLIQDKGASSYCSQDSPFLHFGLGDVTSVDIKVTYPSGRVAELTGVAVDQMLTINESITPVRLLSFDARVSGVDQVDLEWRYAEDSGLFEISKRVLGETIELETMLSSGGVGRYTDQAAYSSTPVTYELFSIERDGSKIRLAEREVRFTTPTVLGANFPNPFRDQTQIPMSSAVAGSGNLEIFDISGRLVQSLRADLVAGQNLISWDGTNFAGEPVPAGVYFYRIAGKSDAARKLIRRP
ncbi:MAG: T9SS type A sorting domain-containing protein [Candidatus Eisenbacteria bacterium]|uniref:T9SS type A sorting domain-containing protein n=1 Tax=Eiseniibacteriota bacterium TaxID=2212470 RepID=A0A7Y2H3I8_UNCEI|nr:T9SS type A sorting domain-containing protein [Candidatus Eisenbacteria bacterium]